VSHLAGTGCAHKRGESTGLDIAKDVVEELLLAALDGDGVVEVLPGERLRLHLETRQILVQLAGAERLFALGETLVELLEFLVLLLEHDDGEVLLALLQELDLAWVSGEQPQRGESFTHKEHLEHHEEDEEAEEDTVLSPSVRTRQRRIAAAHVAPDVRFVVLESGVPVSHEPALRHKAEPRATHMYWVPLMTA
jgi:hypothetical protein